MGGGRAEKAEFVWIGHDARTGARTLMAAMRSWRLNGAAAEVAAADEEDVVIIVDDADPANISIY